jgi:SAM-dependent methyltransferase
MTNEHQLVAAGYDAVYPAIAGSPAFQRIWREHASGVDFPPGFDHISFVTAPQLERMARELRLSRGKTLDDLGCGMAGPSLWVARETGASLIGVDVSPVAVAQAAQRAATLGLEEQARFVVGTFSDTGLPDASTDGIMSEDAMQYAPDKRAMFAEAARILSTGGRFVFTAFELDPAAVEGLPVIGADPVDDYRPFIEGAGFVIDEYEEVPGGLEPVTLAYSAVLDAKETLAAELGEAAFGALAFEMSLTLERELYKRRVLAVATKQ